MSPVVSGGVAPFNGGTITEPLVIDVSGNPANQTAFHVIMPETFDFSVDAFNFEVKNQFGLLVFDPSGRVSSAGNSLSSQGGRIDTRGGRLLANNSDGSSQHELSPANGLGFFGAAVAAQQTGVPVTAAGIHAALVAYGLITA